jgi:hypothetical protein
MAPKHKLPKNIPLQNQGLNCGVNVCELENHVGEKGWSSNWPTKLGLAKKTRFANFSSHLLESV